MNIQNFVALRTGEQSLTSANKLPSQSLTNANNATSAVVSSTDATGEEFETFLTLLTAQIKNQDPLAPLDSTQFVEQLATFSSLELQAKGNQTLEEIVGLLRRDP